MERRPFCGRLASPEGIMPLYEYLCSACAHRFERIVKFSDAPLTVCPQCGQETIDQVISAPAVQFKGSGWYVTDYAHKNSSQGSSAAVKSEGASDTASSGNDNGGSQSSPPPPSNSSSDAKSSKGNGGNGHASSSHGGNGGDGHASSSHGGNGGNGNAGSGSGIPVSSSAGSSASESR
jgi:putative FmdB family regulatory protein